MDQYSSGEELIIKARKPYTITKQRERWTEEEHNRFLEALKLYGRAWQRIEEHIGTKTAVQIRSHAQKFFSKLEKEALVKGVPIGQALDIDIPPPRPKRKPNNPYPRKTSVGAPTTLVGEKYGKLLPQGSSSQYKQVLDLEKEPLPEGHVEEEKTTKVKENRDDSCSELFSAPQEPQCLSASSGNKNCIPTPVTLRNSCAFREFMPSVKGASTQDEMSESYISIELKGNKNSENVQAKQPLHDNGISRDLKLGDSNASPAKVVQVEKTDDLNCTQTGEIQATQTFPRYVPVHILDGSLGASAQSYSPDMSSHNSIFHLTGETHAYPNQSAHQTASVTTEHQNNVPRSSSIHHSPLAFHPPFTPICHSQNQYRSFLQMSSTFSNLIVSTLLQNPAAHAAASFAATFLPYTQETSADSSVTNQAGFTLRQMNSNPSMAAIAAATVAAATAWWAAHGMLPICAPFRSAFGCAPVSASEVPLTDICPAPTANTEKEEKSLQNPPLQDLQLDPEHSAALQAHPSPPKSPTLSSEAEESEGAKPNAGSEPADNEKASVVTELHDSNKGKSRKQVDRSSCGSNTASSSEVETDALEKHEKEKVESKEPDINHLATDSINRRGRNISNVNDSWKEVSEEGRLAFQALFSREVLPQSFSPPHDLKNKPHQETIGEGKLIAIDKDGDTLVLDLNTKTLGSSSINQTLENDTSPRGDQNVDEGLLTLGLGHGKLKARRTGFKPYKRCSVEAKESRLANCTSQGDEKCPKRIRLEGEAST